MSAGRRKDEADLDVFFAAARDMAPDPDPALLARVLDAGEAAQRSFAVARNAPASDIADRLAAIWRAFGGWPSVSGLTAATLAGVWIGMAPPALLEDAVQVWLGGGAGYVIDAEPVTAFLLTEEMQ